MPVKLQARQGSEFQRQTALECEDCSVRGRGEACFGMRRFYIISTSLREDAKDDREEIGEFIDSK
jgi:hypothetical protein